MMRFFRHVAALTVASASIALASCTSLLGDFQVSATSDASVADGSVDSPTGTDGTVDSPGDDASPDSGCPSGQLSCAGSCVPSDVHNCGKCGHDCTNLPHVSGATTCTAGACVFSASACANGFADCNGMPDDGCEADLSQAGHCGSCTTACSGGTPVCASSGDAGTAFACASGCPSAMPTLCSGSCVDTNTNAQNCHMCGTACPTVANAQATCSGGMCGFACNTNYHLCNGACADSTSVNSCGASCTPCAVANATAGCTGGACSVASCNQGFADCNMLAGDGCEISTASDPLHCGTCAGACSIPHATPGCTNGACTIAQCSQGYANCNMIVSDGCEANLTSDSANCNTCGHVCGGGTVCQNSMCVCPTGTTMCGATCVNLQSDGNNCGACGQVCTGTVCNAAYCTPVVLASGAQVSQPTDIATDGGYVFWTNYANPGTVARVTGSGGGYQVIATGQVFPQDITAYGGWVYFTLENAGNGARLMRVANNGGAVTTLASAPGTGFADGIAFDKVGGNSIYWANNGGGSYQVWQYTVSTATNASVRGPVANGYVGGIAADNMGWYYDEPTLNRVITGTINTVIEGNLTNPSRLVAPGNGWVYYVIHGNGTNTGEIHRGKTDATGFNTLASGLSGPSYITTDGVNLYWTDTTDGAIYRMPIGGGTPFALVRQAGIQALTMDATYVYFVNYSLSQVLRIPK